MCVRRRVCVCVCLLQPTDHYFQQTAKKRNSNTPNQKEKEGKKLPYLLSCNIVLLLSRSILGSLVFSSLAYRCQGIIISHFMLNYESPGIVYSMPQTAKIILKFWKQHVASHYAFSLNKQWRTLSGTWTAIVCHVTQI